MSFLSRMAFGIALALGIAGLFGAVRAAEPPVPPRAAFGAARFCGDMDARLAGHLAYTETRLALSDPQKAAFKTLAEAMTAANAPLRQACADLTALPAAPSLPARLEGMQKMTAARAEAMARMLPAVTRFYQSLTPEQQKTADAIMMGGHRPAP